MSQPRYALYFAPDPGSALWRFGSQALGYDAATGESLPIPPVSGIPPQRLPEIVADPVRYGFHATLKPPFRLAEGRTEDGLMAAVAAFAAAERAFVLPPLEVSALGAFLALTVPGRPEALHGLADRTVEHFDPWRAPMDAAERQKRIGSGLGARETQHLDRWGYPYVFDTFRFHMTLTGRVPEAERALLAEHFRKNLGAAGNDVRVEALTLFVQPAPAERFRIAARFPFADAA